MYPNQSNGKKLTNLVFVFIFLKGLSHNEGMKMDKTDYEKSVIPQTLGEDHRKELEELFGELNWEWRNAPSGSTRSYILFLMRVCLSSRGPCYINPHRTTIAQFSNQRGLMAFDRAHRIVRELFRTGGLHQVDPHFKLATRSVRKVFSK